MEHLMGQLAAVLKGMWKFRWQGQLVAWIVAIIGVVFVVKVLPDQYEASARLYVDTQSILKPLMSGLAIQPNVDQQVVMLSRTLISRPNVEKLVRMADLDLPGETKASQEARIERLMRVLEIRSVGRDNLYTLVFRDENGARAQRVIQSLVSIFVESSLGASRKDTDSAKLFINDQIKAYEAKLEAAEARLKEFRLRNIDLQTGDGKDSAARLGELSAQLEQARLDLREAETARDSAKQQLLLERTNGGAGLSQDLLAMDGGANIATPETDARIEAQKKNLDGLLQRFTEEHPDVISTRRLIKELEDQRRREVVERRKTIAAAPSASAGRGSLAFQELTRMLAASEVQVASLRARVSEYASRYAQARSMLKTTPKIEAEAAQLDRDYAINKKNYEDLVARRQSAVMSGDLESSSGVADFRLIDPPRVSSKPVSPNRLMLVPLVLVASLAAGLFASFAASQLRPVFYKAIELREAVGLPLLGVVTMVFTDLDRRRVRIDRMRFIGVSCALLGGFIAVQVAVAILAK